MVEPEDLGGAPKDPYDVYSRKLLRRLDQLIRLKAVSLSYLESGNPELVARGLKHMEKLAKLQLHFYYPRYFGERIDYIILNLRESLNKLVVAKDDMKRLKFSFSIKYFLSKRYREDIRFVTEAIELMEEIKETKLSTIARRQDEIMQKLKVETVFEQRYPLLIDYKRLFDEEKEEIEHLEHHIHELQEITGKEEKNVKKFIGRFASHCQHHHHHEHEEEESHAVAQYLLLVCGLSNALVLVLMGVGGLCLYLGFSVTLVYIAQSLLGAIDVVVDLAISSYAGSSTYQSIKKRFTEVLQARERALAQHSQIAKVFS